jgi:hypothetical protein
MALTLVVFPFIDIFKVVDSRVVVVLSRKDNVVHVAGMGVRDGVTAGVPSSET